MGRFSLLAALLAAQIALAAPPLSSKPPDECVARPIKTVTVYPTSLGPSTSAAAKTPAAAKTSAAATTSKLTSASSRWTTSTYNLASTSGTATTFSTSSTSSATTKAQADQASSSAQPASTTTSVTPSQSSTSGEKFVKKGYRNVVYFTDWSIYGAGFKPQEMPVDELTHVLYAFGDISPDGKVVSADTWADLQIPLDGDTTGSPDDVQGCVKQLFMLKKENRNLKVLLSIGGWTYSQNHKFDPAVGSDAARRGFAATAVNLLASWGFDGLDIDWEYPENPQQAHEFVLLLQACREALDQYAQKNGQNYHYLLTVAAPAGSADYKKLDLMDMDRYLDAWHVMTYDYAGSWDKTTGNSANLYLDPSNLESTKFSTNAAINHYINSGIASDKLVLGLPLYGHSFLDTTGIGKPYSGEGQGTIEPGIWLYRDLPRPGSQVHFDKSVGATYCYNPSTKELVSYDNVQSTTEKADYIMDRGLGGAFFWDASGDKNGSESLVGTMFRSFPALEQSRNMLDYPQSPYANIKNGMA